MKKQKPEITPAEKSTIRDLCYRGKYGRLNDNDLRMVTELYNKFPKEYTKIGDEVSEQVNAEMNPMYRKNLKKKSK